MNVQSFMAKYKSKRECYNFLTVQVEVYLPAYETVTIYFLKDIISGKKKRKYPCADFFNLRFVINRREGQERANDLRAALRGPLARGHVE